MKKALVFICLLTSMSFFAGNIVAQEKQKAKISFIKKSDNTVTLTVTSPAEFYYGGNKHILYIGDKHFDLYDQVNEDGRGSLGFLIPVEDYKSLKDGTRVYLSYGELEVRDEKELEEMSKDKTIQCWSLGKLNKNLLK